MLSSVDFKKLEPAQNWRCIEFVDVKTLLNSRGTLYCTIKSSLIKISFCDINEIFLDYVTIERRNFLYDFSIAGLALSEDVSNAVTPIP
jgi:hypothetical protein